jgi:apolipoprotein N-acyltransferase
VPFAEAIPFWEFPAFRKFMQETVGLEAGWAMGSEIRLFELDSSQGRLRFGTPICFEDAFSDVCRDMALLGADFLLNITNDAWSQRVSAEVQHYAAARFRSIETRLPMLRSTNAGVSCVIDARGQVTAELPLFTAEARIVELPLAGKAGPTVFESFGDWFALATLSLCALFTLILALRSRREPEGGLLDEH